MAHTHAEVAIHTPTRGAVASWIGSALEYDDFFIYGTAAALVFGKVFFPNTNPAAALLLSLATFGVGYVARPIGAFFLGHIGDKFGRKRVLGGFAPTIAATLPGSDVTAWLVVTA